MVIHKVMPAVLGLGVVVAMSALGCGSGTDMNTSAATGDPSSSSSAGAGGAGGAGGSSSGVGGQGGGAAVDKGHPSTETVSAGEVSKSTNYKMVFTFGQPTQNQDKTTSPGFKMRGGLVGATGSAK